ncbi:ribosome recycling factor, partial [mine drainage metagenome]
MDESIIELTLLDAKDRMQKVIAHTHSEFGAFRTGRASSSIVERLPVEYYGTEVPLLQIAGFSVPEARVLVITPYDKGALGAIEKAIQASDVGI